MEQITNDALSANEMTDEFKKFSLKNVEDFLSDNEMKNTRGGSGNGGLANCDPTGAYCMEGWPCVIGNIIPEGYYEEDNPNGYWYFEENSPYFGTCVYEPYLGSPSKQCYCKVGLD